MNDTDQYFDSAHVDPHDSDATWFDLNAGVPSLELAPNLGSRPVIGQNLAISYINFAPNTRAPVHSHSEEQIVLVLEGQVEFEVNGVAGLLGPGMGIVIPPNVPHGARTYDSPCVEIDVFHPPRQALVERLRELTTNH